MPQDKDNVLVRMLEIGQSVGEESVIHGLKALDLDELALAERMV